MRWKKSQFVKACSAISGQILNGKRQSVKQMSLVNGIVLMKAATDLRMVAEMNDIKEGNKNYRNQVYERDNDYGFCAYLGTEKEEYIVTVETSSDWLTTTLHSISSWFKYW